MAKEDGQKTRQLKRKNKRLHLIAQRAETCLNGIEEARGSGGVRRGLGEAGNGKRKTV